MNADPAVRELIKRFSTGTVKPENCFQCGNCTAVCRLSKDSNVFPRRTIRNIQLGLEDRLLESPEPWLCYYCGDCSATCPRDANPGELMMGVRRYLTSRYDWTGISGRLYLSAGWQTLLLTAVAFGVFLVFYLGGSFGRMDGEHVSVNTFIPVEWLHYGDWALAGVLSFFLLTNAWRMSCFLLRKDKGVEISLSDWTGRLKEFALHFLTQKRWSDCEEGATNFRWVKHLLLVSGYLTMMLLVIVLLPWFQRDGMQWHWSALPGYFATGVLLYYTADAIAGRLRKAEQLHKWSHETDWGFLILLFLTALTGILMHVFRLLDLPRPTYYIYVVHLMVAVPMLAVEVPFGKWAHLMYRPLAVYIEAVKESARERAAAEAARAAASGAEPTNAA